MTKYKVFFARTAEELQNQLNNFVSTHNITSIQYSTSAASAPKTGGTRIYCFHNALVEYEEYRDDRRR